MSSRKRKLIDRIEDAFDDDPLDIIDPGTATDEEAERDPTARAYRSVEAQLQDLEDEGAFDDDDQFDDDDESQAARERRAIENIAHALGDDLDDDEF